MRVVRIALAVSIMALAAALGVHLGTRFALKLGYAEMAERRGAVGRRAAWERRLQVTRLLVPALGPALVVLLVLAAAT